VIIINIQTNIQKMKNSKNGTATITQKPLRLWVGISIVALQWTIRFILPLIAPDTMAFSIFGGLILSLFVFVWWLFFSRVQMVERWTAFFLIILAFFATAQMIDKSIATTMMGMMFTLYFFPVICLALVVWSVASSYLAVVPRRIALIATILLASGFWILLRTNGMDGQGHQYFAWRWAQTSEENIMAKTDNAFSKIQVDSAFMVSEAEWSGFRGSKRDGIVHGVKINSDWTKYPPTEIWRRSIGPACSSFAVHGNLLYTQEQRGEFEMVTCYNLQNGKPVWLHRDSTRFWDSHAGAGPRSTPTLSHGRVYSSGATGILNVLDAFDGKLIWSHNAANDTKVKIPGWGYTASPLVTDGVVIVAIAGQLLAYDTVTGNLMWTHPDGGESYSSPHLMKIDGVNQILFTNNSGLISIDPKDGKKLWNLKWTGVPILQPAQINESDFLVGQVSESGGTGMLRINVKQYADTWKINEYWKSNKFRPYFNDFVVHKGHVYGFEGPALVCMDIEKGERQWKGGRYGGQLLLLEDQDLLLLISENGELALVNAQPDKFKEITRFPGIKGKTWNHPVVVGNVLVVRNSEEMAAFKLTLAEGEI